MPADGSWRKTRAARGEAAAGPMEVVGVRQRGGDAVGRSSSSSSEAPS